MKYVSFEIATVSISVFIPLRSLFQRCKQNITNIRLRITNWLRSNIFLHKSLSCTKTMPVSKEKRFIAKIIWDVSYESKSTFMIKRNRQNSIETPFPRSPLLERNSFIKYTNVYGYDVRSVPALLGCIWFEMLNTGQI